MPLPTPNKDEEQSKFIGRCVSFIFKEGTLNNKPINSNNESDRKRATAACFSQWRRKQEQEVDMDRNLYHLDAENDHAIEWVDSNKEELIQFSKEGGKYSAVCVIGDRFYKGKFLPAVELERAHLKMNGAFHDINHMGTTWLDGNPNIEYIVGYQDNTTFSPVTKKMSTEIHINREAPKYGAWKSFVDTCKMANKTPNVSVSFWASNKAVKIKDLPEGVNYKAYGYSEDDTVQYLYDLDFRALSTVLHGACDDKAGCGIGIGMKEDKTDTMEFLPLITSIEEPTEEDIEELKLLLLDKQNLLMRILKEELK